MGTRAKGIWRGRLHVAHQAAVTCDLQDEFFDVTLIVQALGEQHGGQHGAQLRQTRMEETAVVSGFTLVMGLRNGDRGVENGRGSQHPRKLITESGSFSRPGGAPLCKRRSQSLAHLLHCDQSIGIRVKQHENGSRRAGTLFQRRQQSIQLGCRHDDAVVSLRGTLGGGQRRTEAPGNISSREGAMRKRFRFPLP